MKYKKGDDVEVLMEGFMGVEFLTIANVKEVCYVIRAELGNGQFSEMTLTEEELEKRIITK